MKSYKVFDPDWTCRGFQYEVGKTYEMEGSPILCKRGFHFCKKAADCFSYYSFNSNNKVAEVEAVGEIVTGGDKSVTNKIVILRELPWSEVLSIVNTGNRNTGYRNTGDSNTGNRNTGNYNTGDGNTGNRNTGYRNTGDSNTGNGNTGNYNTGNRNTGYRNTGDSNTGDSNTGNGNTGKYNTGYRNTGNYNTGDGNTGNRNTGYRNTGEFNYSDDNTGFFNTEENNVLIFDKPSKYTRKEFTRTEGFLILSDIPFGAYRKDGVLTEYTPQDRQEFWNNLSARVKSVVLSIENFDADKFKLCTGIDVNIK